MKYIFNIFLNINYIYYFTGSDSEFYFLNAGR